MLSLNDYRFTVNYRGVSRDYQCQQHQHHQQHYILLISMIPLIYEHGFYLLTTTIESEIRNLKTFVLSLLFRTLSNNIIIGKDVCMPPLFSEVVVFRNK